MKQLLLAFGITILYILTNITSQDTYYHQRELDKLKFTAEQAAAAAQYVVKSEYAKGNYVFDKDESIKAAEYYIKTDLNLDDNFIPQGNNYWTDKITYTIEFYDDSNTKYPYLFKHPSKLLTKTITSPTVVVGINAGKPRYRILKNIPSAFRIAAHSWEGRGTQ